MFLLRAFAAGVFLSFLAASPACGADQWLKLQSSHFELYTTAGEKKGREALLYFEQVRDFFGKVKKGAAVESKTSVRIIAFRSEKEYKPYRFNEAADAYYLEGYDRDYIVMHSIAPESYPVAVHEYMHLLVKHWGLDLPVWLNEGLADVHSTLKPFGKQVAVGQVIPRHYYLLKQNKWMSLEALTTVDHNSPSYNERDRAGIFYAESWALVHMLNFSAPYRGELSKCLTLLATGVPASNAFWQTYAKTLGQVQKDLEQYMRGTQFSAALFDVKLEKSAEEPDVSPAPPLESGMVLADLLALTGKKAEAKEAYTGLGKEFPQSWEVEAGLAELAWRGHEIEEARRHFARAAELGATNPRLYYDYAIVLHRAGERDAVLAPVLKKAVELDPGYQEAHRYLAFCLLQTHDYQGAVDHFTKVTHLKTDEAFAYYHGLAYANYRLEKKDAAKTAAESARKYARTPEETVKAEELLRAMSQEPGPRKVERAVTAQPARDEFNDGKPTLARRDAAPLPLEPPQAAPVETQRPSIQGTLQQIDCLGKVVRLRVLVGQKHVALAITDPQAVRIVGTNSGTLDLTCGPQKGKGVVLEYDGPADAKLGTVGVVRSIEFQ